MIDVAFSRADHLDAEEAHARALLDRLESAILAKAFRGELVPQDPSDEPASVLLARIREERAAQPKGLRKRNSSKDKAMTQPPLSPRDRLLKDSERWPKSGVPFAEVAQRVSLPHDEMRDTLFALMRGPTPILRQTFDEKRELMLIQRNAA
jgi:type I restriction enzyme S subunit